MCRPRWLVYGPVADDQLLLEAGAWLTEAALLVQHVALCHPAWERAARMAGRAGGVCMHGARMQALSSCRAVPGLTEPPAGRRAAAWQAASRKAPPGFSPDVALPAAPEQARLAECARLAEEMGVQAAAIEAARANVEHHYSYICAHFQAFMDGCGCAALRSRS